MSKHNYKVLQERPKKTYRIKFLGCVDVVGHCELEARAILESLTIGQIPFKDIEWIRELDDNEKAEFGTDD